MLGTSTSLAIGATADDVCRSYGELAEKIMTLRQRGVSLSELIDSLAKTEDEDTNKVTRSMILSAYEQPQYGTAEYQKAKAGEFKNNIELFCYQSQ